MFKVILKKELRRVFTDRRLIFSSFLLPALSTFLAYTIMGMMATSMFDDINEHTASVYIQNSPESFKHYVTSLTDDVNMEIQWIEAVEIEETKKAILDGEADLLVVFEDRFQEKIADYQNQAYPPEIKTYYNPSENYSETAKHRFIDQLLIGYEDILLAERFGNIDYSIAFIIDETNEESAIQNEEKAKGKALSMILPMIIGIILFSSAMGIGIDTIAGEKERGTMATLLLAPVKRETIAFGKVAGLAIVSIISAICSLGGILASLPFASSILAVGGNGGIPQFSVGQYGQLLLIMLSLVGVNVGFICLLSVKARSVKEAGTYITPIFLTVMLTAFSTMFSQGTPETYRFAIPVYSNILAIKAMLNFELGLIQFWLTIASSIVTTLILIKAITNTFNNEKVMLNA